MSAGNIDGGPSDGRIGSRFRRIEDPPLLTGRGRFVDDIQLPGLLHVAFVRSPEAHAAIRSIEVAAARALSGVHAVLTLDDLARVLLKRRMVREGQGASRSLKLLINSLAR